MSNFKSNSQIKPQSIYIYMYLLLDCHPEKLPPRHSYPNRDDLILFEICESDDRPELIVWHRVPL